MLFLTFGCAAASLCYGQANHPAQRSDSLILVAGANNPQYLTHSDGRQQLIYTCEAEYPAQAVVAAISQELQKKNWKPLKEDFLNPGLPSSFVRGWVNFEDDAEHPATYVHQWIGDWESSARDIVRYSLEYSSQNTSTRDLHTLRITALYIPARAAIEIKNSTTRKE